MKKQIRSLALTAAALLSPISQSFGLTTHTSADFDAYADETDATQNISTVTYNERQYETYAFIKGKDASKTTIYGTAAVDQSGHIKVLTSGTSSSSIAVSTDWYEGTLNKLSGESVTYDQEFASYAGGSSIATYAGNDVTPCYTQLADKTLTLSVTGYDLFGLAIEKISGYAKSRYIKVTINGVEATCVEGYTTDNEKIYHYTLDPSVVNTIVVSDACNSTSNQSKVGAYFSLRRIPKVVSSATVSVSGKTVSADAISTATVHFTVPYASDITSLKPDFTTITGGTLVGPTTAQDFTNSVTTPIVYTFTYDKDGDGVLENYVYNVTVEKIPASTVRTLDKFAYVIDGETRYATIDETAKTVKVVFPYTYGDGRKNEAAKKTISTSIQYSDDLAKAALGNGTALTEDVAVIVDYSAAQSVVITSEDGNKSTYTVNIEYEEPSTACDLLTFALPLSNGKNAEGIISENTVNVYMKANDLKTSSPFTPVYTLSPLSEVAPTTVIPMTFASPNALTKIFRVNAEKDNTFKDYTIKVNVDDTAPTVVSIDAPSDLTAAPLAGAIKMTFSEPVKAKEGSATAGKISIKKKSDNTEVCSETLLIENGGLTGNMLFSGLESLTEYVITIESGSTEDYAGNELIYSKTFKTADGTLHTLPYCSTMDGSSYEQPAYIKGPVYDMTADTRAATTNQNGAYRLIKDQTLTITADRMGTLDVVIFSYGKCTYNITAGSVTKDGAITIAYDNDGVEEQVEVNSSTTTSAVITNTGENDIYIPYISVSDVNAGAITDKDCNCK